MLNFVNYLKLIAAILITNSHFGKVWPVSSMATGGLLGNVIFLAVSGYLLYNVKLKFPKWFLKRFLRVYPVMAIFTLVVSLFGIYSLKSFDDFVRMFLYPTNYIFIVWLLVCYCVLYVVAYLDKHVNHFLEISMGVVLLAWVLTYVVFYDKSAYTVDNVYEPFILFLYVESMLLGSFFKKHGSKIGVFKMYKPFATGIALIAYFASKILVSKVDALLSVQILNQFVLFAALYFTFDLFMSIEPQLSKAPKWIAIPTKYVSNITLQIYIAQFVVLMYLQDLVFPVNLIAVVVCILLAASVLYYAELYIRKGINYWIESWKKKRTGEKNEEC